MAIKATEFKEMSNVWNVLPKSIKVRLIRFGDVIVTYSDTDVTITTKDNRLLYRVYAF